MIAVWFQAVSSLDDHVRCPGGIAFALNLPRNCQKARQP